jgi:hypothetical protein
MDTVIETSDEGLTYATSIILKRMLARGIGDEAHLTISPCWKLGHKLSYQPYRQVLGEYGAVYVDANGQEIEDLEAALNTPPDLYVGKLEDCSLVFLPPDRNDVDLWGYKNDDEEMTGLEDGRLAVTSFRTINKGKRSSESEICKIMFDFAYARGFDHVILCTGEAAPEHVIALESTPEREQMRAAVFSKKKLAA